MEEMCRETAKARAIFDRWMSFEPDHAAWMAYIKVCAAWLVWRVCCAACLGRSCMHSWRLLRAHPTARA
jgi:hypothetical protein